jgi:hypothetical protein
MINKKCKENYTYPFFFGSTEACTLEPHPSPVHIHFPMLPSFQKLNIACRKC